MIPIAVRWTRRTRIDGDSWEGADVPLGEDTELYLVRVLKNGSVVREVETTTPSFVYSPTDMSNDAISAPFDFEVAQVSSQFGPGPFKRIVFNG